MAYEWNPSVPEAGPDSQTIWRTMDFTKFESVIESRTLYFARADQFDDQWEGAIPYPDLSDLRAMFESARMRESQTEELIDAHRSARKSVFINCWHGNEVVSASMWKMYSISEESISIRSTVGRLKRCFANNPNPIFLGKVSYIDYKEDQVPQSSYPLVTLAPFLCKRDDFSFENEIRALRFQSLPGPGEPPKGLQEPIDLTTLVESVLLSPKSGSKFHNRCKSLLSTHKLRRIPIHKSTLWSKPP